MSKFGIYIHWPYCLSKCPYCDFASSVCKAVDEDALLAGYQRDLEKTAELVNAKAPAGKRTVTSVFFGGGTPSLMSLGMTEKLLKQIDKLFALCKTAEISMEANPDAIDLEKMQALKSLGINRLSLGVQALNEADLRFLGRRHTLKTALTRIEQMHKVFDNCSIDLIYARANQTLNAWRQELGQALAFGLPHLSLYQLTIEEGTVFERHKVEGADDEQARALYLETLQMTDKAGIPLYEVSNFAKSGFECQHNLLYWQGDDYAGIGPAAHGRLGLIATENPRQVKAWLTQGGAQTLLSEKERFEEKLLMGLRLKKGMSALGLNPTKIDEMVGRGWLHYDARANWIAPTLEGLLMLNQLILELLPD